MAAEDGGFAAVPDWTCSWGDGVRDGGASRLIGVGGGYELSFLWEGDEAGLASLTGPAAMEYQAAGQAFAREGAGKCLYIRYQ